MKRRLTHRKKLQNRQRVKLHNNFITISRCIKRRWFSRQGFKHPWDRVLSSKVTRVIHSFLSFHAYLKRISPTPNLLLKNLFQEILKKEQTVHPSDDESEPEPPRLSLQEKRMLRRITGKIIGPLKKKKPVTTRPVVLEKRELAPAQQVVHFKKRGV